MTRPLLLAFCVLLPLAGHAQQVPAPDAWTTTVRGSVIRSDTRQPVAGAHVSINMTGASPVTTDAQGRFRIEKVRPGRYNVFASSENYLPAGGTGYLAIVTVAARRAPDAVELVLTPYASISGTVRDPEGRPLPAAMIELTTLTTVNGRRVMSPTGTRRQADDRGQFRLHGLYPGEYFVRADPSYTVEGRAPKAAAWVRTYSPAATNAADAEPITAAAGADIAGRDITIQAVRSYSVSGTIDKQLTAEQREFLAARTLSGPVSSFWVMRVDADVTDGPVMYENARARSSLAGRAPEPGGGEAFELHGVAPGIYELFPIASVMLPQDNEFALRFPPGRARVTVVDRDITGVNVIIRRGQDVPVREVSRVRTLEMQSVAAGTGRFPDEQLRLAPRDPVPLLSGRDHTFGVSAGANGLFVVPNVPPGVYDVEFNLYYRWPTGEYLADVRQNGMSVVDSGITIDRQPPGQIELVFEPAATVHGTVRSRRGGTPVDQRVVLLSRQSGRLRTLSSRGAIVGADGAFTIPNAAPGEYLVFATTDRARNFVTEDETVITELSRRAQRITLAPGTTTKLALESIDVPAAPARRAVQPAPKPAAPPPPAATATGTLTSPSAVIAGRVLDSQGRPVRTGRVQLFTLRHIDGQRTFVRFGNDVAMDDRGEFRIAGLGPGRYYLVAAPLASHFPGYLDTHRPHIGASSFYPGVADIAAALPLDVTNGETRADFRLHTPPVFTISGRVALPDGQDVTANASFYLMPRGGAAATAAAHMTWSDQAFVTSTKGGFSLREVPAGAYDLYVWDRGINTGMVPVAVTSTSVSGVTAVLTPTATVTLRITVDGKPVTTAPRIHPVHVMPSVAAASPKAVAAGDGVFTMTAVEGRFRIDTNEYSANAYIADVRYNGVSAPARGLEVDRNAPGPIDIDIRTDSGYVDGSVVNADGTPARRVTVVLAPAASHRNVGSSYRTAQTNDGRVSLGAVPPGEYTVFTMSEREMLETERLADVAARPDARPIRVAPRSRTQVVVPVQP